MYKYFELYKNWSRLKLECLDSIPDIHSIDLSKSIATQSICDSLKRFNFAIYDFEDLTSNESKIFDFLHLFNLKEPDKHYCLKEDLLTRIEQVDTNNKYIPYSNKPINWHTDGYYNEPHQIVYSFLLHCVQPSNEGGENGLIDPEQIFIYMMENYPRYLEALMIPDAMTIPANIVDGEVKRKTTSTAIFKVLNKNHDILMRYSQRKRNIEFKDNQTKEAVDCLDEYLNSDNSPKHKVLLKSGQGVLCNNVLHMRTGFKDTNDKKRLYYRARFYNRIEC